MNQQFRRVRAYIDTDALRLNVKAIREKTGDKRVMAVVKADAYGHGVDNVVPVLLEEGIDAFAVASLREAIRVRSLTGPEAMILVLGYTDPSEYEEAIRSGIDLAVYTLEQAKAMAMTAAAIGMTAGIQIKVETGMQRIGFPCNQESLKDIQAMASMDGIKLKGAFTHFARADEASKEHAKEQQDRFEGFLRDLEQAGVDLPLTHSANSAAIMEYPRAYRAENKMVRAGIILYGMYPSDEMDRELTKLTPVMTLKSHVIHVKDVEAGVAIGYGGTYVTDRPTRVATICVGYADGYPRHLSNVGSMLIHGKRARILGRVCMDQTMVDVTDIPEVKVGDEVILFGKDLSLDELAQAAGTISYEILCQLTPRSERTLLTDEIRESI